MGPFKCPECGVWWVGLEHRCVRAVVRSWTDVPLPPPSITIQYVPPLQVTTTSPPPPFIRPVNS